MAIKIYSDKTQKFYDTVEDANKAEKEAIQAENRERVLRERKAAEEKEKKEKEAAERKAMAAEVTEALKAMNEAQKVYREKLEAFCKKYGTFHYSTDGIKNIPTLFDVFNPFFKDFLN